MNGMDTKKVLVILTHALVGWALCGAIIGVGFAIWSVETTLIVHLIGAPVVFALLSWLYLSNAARMFTTCSRPMFTTSGRPDFTSGDDQRWRTG